MFSIIWNDGAKCNLKFASVGQAIGWGNGTGEDYTVVDLQGQVVHHEFAPRQGGFVDVSGMSYDQVRRMNRE